MEANIDFVRCANEFIWQPRRAAGAEDNACLAKGAVDFLVPPAGVPEFDDVAPRGIELTYDVLEPYLGVAIARRHLFGLFNGWFITQFQVQPIVGTLVMFIAGRGVGQVLTNGNLQAFKNPTFQFIGLGRMFGVPCQVVIMLALVAAAAWVLRSTLFGRQILSVGGNERAARLSGVPVAFVKRWVYATSGLCAGIAGLVVVSINSSSDANLVGLGMELDAIAAVAVGGTPFTGGQATVVGTLVGALLIQLVRYTLLANGVPDAAALVVKGAIIAGAVWSQQQGRSA